MQPPHIPPAHTPHLHTQVPAQAHVPGAYEMPLQSPFGVAPSQVPPAVVPPMPSNSTRVEPPPAMGPGSTSRVCPSLMSALWSTADNGRMALDYFGSSSVTDMATVIVTLSALLPVAQFAPGYVNWMRNPTATVAIFAVTFQSVYPALHAGLVAVGSRVGIECQQEIRSLAVEMYGMFSGQLHPASVQALMLYVWCSPGSPQADLLNSMLGDYLDTPAHDLSAFRAACGDVRSMRWSSTAAGSVFSARQLSHTQGHMRLDPAMSPRNFYAQWVFLRLDLCC